MSNVIFLIAAIAATYYRCAFAQLALANNETAPTSEFKTRPQAFAPAFNMTLITEEITPGYIFIGPYSCAGAGPYIYDKFGNLVWDGFGIVGPTNAHNFRPCQYKGAQHLCLSAINQQEGYGVGNNLIIDNNYRTVATIQTGGTVMPTDMHEFQLLNDGETALLVSYQAVQYDMTYFGITTGQGWLMTCVFQEIDVETGEVLFEWLSANHVDPADSDLKPNGTDVSGDGLTGHTAFDYFHINSVEKSETSGDYLISARHMSTIYLINGTDHNIIWRLSFLGQSDFECENFDFSYQHDARFVSENDTMTVISFFDNASDDYDGTSDVSRGRIVALDHNSGVATQIMETLPPEPGLSSGSQGNTQVLSNGNIFNGWGSWPWISEYAPDGTLILAGKFAEEGPQNYRSFSFEWESTPANTLPQVYSYALNTDSANTVYVSWNGATTVSSWRFWGAQEIGGDPFEKVGSTDRNNRFETHWIMDKFYQWVQVEALDAKGKTLAYSMFTSTFVPSEALAEYCDENGCPNADSYEGRK